MKITELKLFTNQLEKQKEFFLKVLGFEFLDETEKGILQQESEGGRSTNYELVT